MTYADCVECGEGILYGECAGFRVGHARGEYICEACNTPEDADE